MAKLTNIEERVHQPFRDNWISVGIDKHTVQIRWLAIGVITANVLTIVSIIMQLI